MVKTIEELAAKERKEYFREWRATHRENVKRHNKTYWERKAAQHLAEQERDGEK